MLDSRFAKATGLISGLVGILGFLTGIQSIPTIVAQSTGTAPPALVDSALPKTFSYGIFFVSQGVYFFSYFLVVRFLASRVLISLVPPKQEGAHVFFHAVLMLIGFGLSWMFAESFWGSLPNILEKIDDKHIHPVVFFLILAGIGNVVAVIVAYDWQSAKKRTPKQPNQAQQTGDATDGSPDSAAKPA
jgi:hypothetical protein